MPFPFYVISNITCYNFDHAYLIFFDLILDRISTTPWKWRRATWQRDRWSSRWNSRPMYALERNIGPGFRIAP